MNFLSFEHHLESKQWPISARVWDNGEYMYIKVSVVTSAICLQQDATHRLGPRWRILWREVAARQRTGRGEVERNETHAGKLAEQDRRPEAARLRKMDTDICIIPHRLAENHGIGSHYAGQASQDAQFLRSTISVKRSPFCGGWGSAAPGSLGALRKGLVSLFLRPVTKRNVISVETLPAS
ncbi:hypothetical protein CC78DRAFT_573559 [Lojkania enalia]|uniref:Uncharacterized protein n=1 Tax=Lojkania enalia TaxID=147567 RepID=A0A9P4NDE1_9PLEO|nr:hypothetical protein CC78DRAFT_573559 [Didymosphaeria enalia]